MCMCENERINFSQEFETLKDNNFHLNQLVSELTKKLDDMMMIVSQGFTTASIINRPLTKEEAADVLSISVHTIHKLLKTGEIPHFKLNEKLIRIQPQHLHAFMEREAAKCRN